MIMSTKKFEISRIYGIPPNVEIPECLEDLRYLPQSEFVPRAFQRELEAKRVGESIHACLNSVMQSIGITSECQGTIELPSSDILTCSFVDSYKVDKKAFVESPHYSRVMAFVKSDKNLDSRISVSRKDLELYLRAHPTSSLDISEVVYNTGYYKIIKTKNREEPI